VQLGRRSNVVGRRAYVLMDGVIFIRLTDANRYAPGCYVGLVIRWVSDIAIGQTRYIIDASG